MSRVSLDSWLAGSVRTMLKRIEVLESELNVRKLSSKFQTSYDLSNAEVFTKKVQFVETVDVSYRRLKDLCDELLQELAQDVRLDEKCNAEEDVVASDMATFLESLRLPTAAHEFAFNAKASEFIPNWLEENVDFEEKCATDPKFADAVNRAAKFGCDVPFRRLMDLPETWHMDTDNILEVLLQNGGQFIEARSALQREDPSIECDDIDWDD